VNVNVIILALSEFAGGERAVSNSTQHESSKGNNAALIASTTKN
jgi:hypothetical protein